MRKLLTAIFVFIISAGLIAQDKNKSNVEVENTIHRHLGIKLKLAIDYKLNQNFTYPFMISHLPQEVLLNGDPSTIWMRTEFALSYSSHFNMNTQKVADDLTLPLYKQYIENSKFDAVTYILGMAQTAAAGYMSYSHIKKYGFWK